MTRRQSIRRRVPLDEGHLGYVVRAAPGPTLILIPGSFSDSTAWDDVAAELPNHIAQVIIELRGHGDSWPPARDGSIEQFARDVLLVVDDLSLERFFIGGHSIGGMVALEVASVRPGAVRGVISIEGWTSHQAARDAFAGDMDSTLSPGQRARKAARRTAVTARWTQAQIEAFARIWTRWDGYAFLAATEVPILQVWGDRGRPKPTLDKLRIPARPNIQVRWAENASHSLPLERPKELAEAMAAFIHNVETGGDPNTRDSG